MSRGNASAFISVRRYVSVCDREITLYRRALRRDHDCPRRGTREQPARSRTYSLAVRLNPRAERGDGLAERCRQEALREAHDANTFSTFEPLILRLWKAREAFWCDMLKREGKARSPSAKALGALLGAINELALRLPAEQACRGAARGREDSLLAERSRAVQAFWDRACELAGLFSLPEKGARGNVARKEADALGQEVNKLAVRLEVCADDQVPYVAPRRGEKWLYIRHRPGPPDRKPVRVSLKRGRYVFSQNTGTAVETCLGEWRLPFDRQVRGSRGCPIASPTPPVSPLRALIDAVTCNRDALEEAVQHFGPGSPERHAAYREIHPGQSNPDESFFTYARCRAQDVGNLLLVGPKVDALQEAWSKFARAALDVPHCSQRWAVASSTLNDALNGLIQYVRVTELAQKSNSASRTAAQSGLKPDLVTASQIIEELNIPEGKREAAKKRLSRERIRIDNADIVNEIRNPAGHGCKYLYSRRHFTPILSNLAQ